MTPACHPSNYAKGRGGYVVSYIVIHFTANDGDTALGNCTYFANNVVKASAHYFVDEHGWKKSAEETDTAWHCGAQSYRHNACRNANSIGIELCSRKDATGRFTFLPETVRFGQLLVRSLLTRYGLSPDRVLRHYDVTGKPCPLPFVENTQAWNAFLTGLVEKAPTQTPPAAWAKTATDWAVREKLFLGDETGNFRWQDTVTRQELAVVLHRLHT